MMPDPAPVNCNPNSILLSMAKKEAAVTKMMVRREQKRTQRLTRLFNHLELVQGQFVMMAVHARRGPLTKAKAAEP